jgi:hypothetical protein
MRRKHDAYMSVAIKHMGMGGTRGISSNSSALSRPLMHLVVSWSLQRLDKRLSAGSSQ